MYYDEIKELEIEDYYITYVLKINEYYQESMYYLIDYRNEVITNKYGETVIHWN